MIKSLLKILFWILLAIVLLVAGVLIGTVKILTPERLTPIVEKVANDALNADVSIASVELSLRKSMPFLSLDIDSVVVISRDIRSLPTSARDTIPQWGDTLLSVKRMHGAINVFKIARSMVDLRDLEIEEPKVNILVVNDSLNNFSIVPPSHETDSSKTTIPDIRLNHFSLISPRPIRYADLSQDMYMEARITSAVLSNSTDSTSVSSSDTYKPIYHVDFDSSITTPLLEIIGQHTCPVGFDGIVEWRHQQPYQITLRNFNFLVSQLSGNINTCINFEDSLTVETMNFAFTPIKVSEFLAMVPDSIAKEYNIPKGLVTDATLNFSGELSRPYVVGTTEMPYARLRAEIPPCELRYGKAALKHMEILATINAQGGTPNDLEIEVDKIRLEGPATSIEIKGRLSEMLTDPLFDGEIDGYTDLSRLPDILVQRIGATLKGKVNLNTSVIARPSMFSRQGFHRLRITGDVNVKDFMYLSDDTLSMYALHNTDLHFGTNERFSSVRGVTRDSLLSAKLTVDTANILASGFDIKVGHLTLGVGAQNKNSASDTTAVIPMGGILGAKYFSLFSVTDSAGLRTRDIRGAVSMRRYLDDAHLPQFNLNLGIGTLSTGDNHTRFMVNDSRLRCSLSKLPDHLLSAPRREIRHLADSLHRRHPDLSIDSVYIMAAKIRARNRRPGHHRVHTEMSAQDQEIIDWGTSTAMRRLLLDWNVEGSLTAGTARLFTAAFPLRNRVEGLDINFNNDSITLHDVRYKAGGSDFLISGNITNMKQALTSRRQRSPLKINFMLVSDFIDINQLSHAFFTGSAQKHKVIDDELSDIKTLEQDIEEHSDSIAPLLLPTNIDAELRVQAHRVAYSDFVLDDFTGTVLMYDGALNLHQLRAASEVGSIDLTALYSAPSPKDIDFGFGMELSDFNIRNFQKLVPAVDTIMPMLRDLSGIVSANLALTSRINEHMDLELPTIKAAINLSGDSLQFIDPTTFKKVSKWLMFKDKDKNMIDHVSAEMIVENGEMHIFPFIFDFDRYKIGVQGYNDFDMNLNYHIAVLKSPIPFKFGINIKGNYDKLKIRLGRAKFNEDTSLERTPIVNDTRINLINQFQNVFRRGVKNSHFATLNIGERPAADIDLDTDTLSAADSLYFRQQGLIPE